MLPPKKRRELFKKYNVNNPKCLKIKGEVIVVDCETDGLDPYRNLHRPFMLSYATNKGETGIIYKDSDLMKQFLEMVFYNKKNQVVGHNMKFDMGMFSEAGYIDLNRVYLRGAKIHCTMVQSKLIMNLGRHNLGYLAQKYLRINTSGKNAPYEWIKENGRKFKKETGDKPNYSDVPEEIIIPYAGDDALWTLKLHYYFKIPREKIKKLYHMDIMQIFIALGMEKEGVVVNITKVKKFHKKAVEDLAIMSGLILKALGASPTTNVNSNKQLIIEFFERKQRDTLKPMFVPVMRTPTGLASLSSLALLRLVKDEKVLDFYMKYSNRELPISEYIKEVVGFDIPDFILVLLLRYRTLKKITSTYYFNIIERTIPDPNRKGFGILHCQFNPFLTKTGRYSSGSNKQPVDNCPGINLQNIPKIGDVRSCFTARKGYLNFHVDYSQIELRLGAHYSEDRGMISDYKNKRDLHLRTASNIFEKDKKKIITKERDVGKTLNFGIWYGMGASALVDRLFKDMGMLLSLGQASSFIRKFMRSYPMIAQLMSRVRNDIVSKGYVEDFFGRKYFCDESEAYKATNYLIQGCASVIIKMAMARCYSHIMKCKWDVKIIMTVHDEIVFQIPEKGAAKMVKRFISIMEEFKMFKVAIVAEAEKYNSKGDWAHKKAA